MGIPLCQTFSVGLNQYGQELNWFWVLFCFCFSSVYLRLQILLVVTTPLCLEGNTECLRVVLMVLLLTHLSVSAHIPAPYLMVGRSSRGPAEPSSLAGPAHLGLEGGAFFLCLFFFYKLWMLSNFAFHVLPSFTFSQDRQLQQPPPLPSLNMARKPQLRLKSKARMSSQNRKNCTRFPPFFLK